MNISPVTTSHSSSESRRPRYDVFLSFRGADTRPNFAKFLYMKLTDALFEVFIDNEDLEKGKNINNELIEAINHSMISIPIISQDYASSKSCLMELEHMLKCMDHKNHTIIPIFYLVDPSDVRHCNGPIATSLLGHNHSHIDFWKSALNRIGNMSGHHLCEEDKEHHINIIKRIICEVRQKLRKEDLIEPKQLVVVHRHVRSIMEKLKVDHHDGRAVTVDKTLTKVLVISGIAGVGKTVLAKYVYNKLYHLYDHCSFCGQIQAEIEHHTIVSVQNKLISGLLRKDAQMFNCPDKALTHIKNRFGKMKVLVLLDDVNDQEQLRSIVGELDWLGLGSRVILTSRRHDVLRKINGAESFVLEPMEQDEALKLFSRHAFGTDSPREEFETLSTDIVDATGRLPAALEIVGSSLLHETSEKLWRETLTDLKKGHDEGVKAVLNKCLTTLDKNPKKIFLDIACFFNGKDKRIPYYMWDDCDYSPCKSISALHARSLVDIRDKKLCMLKILEDFGRGIVEDEDSEPCKRSRLWNHKEALDVLESSKGTTKVEALRLEFGEFGDRFVGRISFRCNNFNGLENLRFLKLDRADIQGDLQNCFSRLRWLHWQGDLKILEIQSRNLDLQDLVILDLSESQVDKDWGGWDLLKQAKKLKVLKVNGCFRLIATPTFPASMKLERFILEGCHKLAFIKPSIGYLETLVSLNMKQCNCLYELPNLGPLTCLKELVIDGTSISRIDFQEGSMEKLKTLSACDCKDLTEISDSIRYLKSLKYLALDGTGIQTLQESIGSLEKLKTLSLKNCRSLFRLPDGIGKLRSLQFLDLSDTMIRDLPPSVKDWEAMKVLRMRGTFIEEFPEAILNLEKLEEIDFSLCRSLKGSLEGLDFSRLSYLAVLKLSNTQICCQPESFHRLPRLQLDIGGCNILQRPPQSPSSLINVPLHSDLSTLDPHVMVEGVGEKRRRDERERECGRQGGEHGEKEGKERGESSHRELGRKAGEKSEERVYKRRR